MDNMTGVNDSSCWEGGYSTPCLSLNLALKGAQHYNNSTIILLQPGQHQLYSGSETQLKNMSQLAIVGNGSEGEVVIKCQPLAGLAFLQSQAIEMRNVTIFGCSAVQNSTSKYAKRYSLVYLKIQVSAFFHACNGIRLTDVNFIMSNGTGVVLYNPVGVVYMDSCHFMHNGLSVEQTAMLTGGGGLVIEANDITSQSFYVITNSTFTNNTASSGQFTFLSPTINPSSGYFGLGRGGGISVVFRGTASNNTVQLNNVHLKSNKAQFGAGLFLALYGKASKNTVGINGVKTMENRALETSLGTLLPSTSGGGALIELAATGPDYPSGNTINITSSRFISNAAEIGGGLTVSAVYDSGCFNADNILLIENCTFDNNKAFQGSSVYLTQSGKSQQPILDTTMSNSNFANGHCGDTLTHVLPCLGSVFLRFFPLILKGVSMFTGNSVSALGLRSSSIELLSSTQLQFINNSAVDGAALHIVDCSSLVVKSGTDLIFKNNTASHRGGAIYSETCTFEQTGGRDCFIRHSNTALHPDEWKINVNFSDNRAADLGDSIYTDSIQSCIWFDQSSPSNDKLSIFCWKGWFYKENCFSQLRSGPAYITGPTQYTLYPGECIDLKDFTVRDDWSNDITNQTNIQVDSICGAVNVINYSQYYMYCQCSLPIPIDQCPIYYYEFNRPCTSTEISLESDCSLDYANHTSQILVHPHQLLSGIVLEIRFRSCDNDSKCDPTQQRCAVTDRIILPVCNHSCKYDYYDYHLCGSCIDDDYGIAINIPQFTCVKCESTGVSIFIFLQLVPGLLMMVLLTVLHVNITNGNLNGYVLYSQIVSLQIPNPLTVSGVSHGFMVSPIIPLILYSIWNLNFLPIFPVPFCVPYVRTAVETVLLQYVIAIYPLLFIVVSYSWIHWYNNGYRFVVTITRPVHQLLARFWQKFKIHPSLIDTYAGLILLSYMRFLAVSVRLLQLIVLDLQSTNYEHLTENIALAVLAILCLLVFVVFPMAVLLLYHFKIFQRCLTWCKLNRPGLHALVDAYQGCFKNSATDGSERRYFAGIYLLFRFFYVSVFVLISVNYLIQLSQPCLCFVMAGLVVILRPYKKTTHNVIDFMLLFSMTAVSAVSFVFGTASGMVYGAFPFYFPFLVLIVYIIYRLLKSCCCDCVTHIKQKRATDQPLLNNKANTEHKPLLPVTTIKAVNDEYIEDDLYADRILNPDGYKSIN